MSNRPRPVWLALAAAGLLVAFSVTSALGAGPPEDKTSHGQVVSDFVHDLLFGDQDSGDADEPEDEDTAPDEEAPEDEEAPADEEVTDEEVTDQEEPADEESETGQPDNHGACVSQVAKGPAVGGPKGNHGGAVSEAARVTCREGSEGGGDEG